MSLRESSQQFGTGTAHIIREVTKNGLTAPPFMLIIIIKVRARFVKDNKTGKTTFKC